MSSKTNANVASPTLRVEIRANSSLQPRSTFAQDVGQVFQVIASRDAKLAHKVLGRGFEVAVILLGLVLGPAKVSVGRDRRGALEAL